MQIKLLKILINRPNITQNIRSLTTIKSPSPLSPASSEQPTPNEKRSSLVERKKPVEKKLSVEELIAKKFEVFSPRASKLVQTLIKKATGKDEEEEDEAKGERRKGPFKNYYGTEERDQKQIMFYEEYFDKVTKRKDLDNYMVYFVIQLRSIDIILRLI